MKILLIELIDDSMGMSQVHAGLRKAVGTCEVYALTNEHLSNIERFFERFIRLTQFDRIVLQLPQQVIYEQSRFFRQLPYLSILALSSPYSSLAIRRLHQNMQVMPWIRFISDEYTLIHKLIEQGYDAHWVRPVLEHLGPLTPHTTANPMRLFLYDQNGDFFRNYTEQVARQAGLLLERIENASKDIAQIGYGDLFIYLPDSHNEDMRPVIQAMANGAIVLMADPGTDQCLRYGWRNSKTCVFVDRLEEIPTMLETLVKNPDACEEIAFCAQQHAQTFSATQIGQEIGAVLVQRIRKASDYPKKRRVFGFEI